MRINILWREGSVLFLYFFFPKPRLTGLPAQNLDASSLHHSARSAFREWKASLNIFPQSLEPHEKAKASTNKTLKKDNKQPSFAFPNYLTNNSFFAIPDSPTLTAKRVETDICLSTTSFSSYWKQYPTLILHILILVPK